jgi:predicted transcriptional regulator of viral defense system
MKKKNLINEIEKGKYTLLDTPLEITPYLTQPSYISFLYAFYIHGATDQIPLKIQIASARRKKSIFFKNTEIEFIKMNVKRIFGYEKTMYGSGYILLADTEKAVIDSLILPRHCNISETWKVIQTQKLEYDKLLKYAKKMHSKILLKRLGFLLDKTGKDYYKQLESSTSKKFELLNPLKKKEGEKNRKWKLVINEAL